ncbi:hypothetical protein [Sphingomonas sp. UYP23]
MTYQGFKGLFGGFVLFAAVPLGATESAPAGPPKPPASAISAESFGQLPFMEPPKLSPDGTRIATKHAIKGQQRLASIPLDKTQQGGLAGL